MANETRDEDKSQAARSDITRGFTDALVPVNNTRNNGGNEIRPEIIHHTDVSEDAPLDFSTKKYKKRSVLLDQLLSKTTNIISQEDRSASQNANISVISTISGKFSNGSTELSVEPITIIRPTSPPDSVSSPPESVNSSVTNVPKIPGFFPAMSSFPLAFYDPRKGTKPTRPFKAYPRDNMSLPLGYYGIPISMPFPLVEGVNPQLLASSSDEIYAQYRKQILNSQDKPSSKIDNNNPISITSDSGQYGHTSTTPSVNSGRNSVSGNSSGSSDSEQTLASNGTTPSRKRSRSLPDERKDEAYWERRRKNNEAAKRSRDARRAKEDEIAIRAAFLEQENLKLRVEVAALKNETAKLRCMLYNS